MQTVHFSIADIAIIFLYFFIIIYIGIRYVKVKKNDVANYLVAGRSLTLPSFVASLVSTWYGGILGTGEYSYKYGISNWLVFGIPYYIFALIFALLLAERVRKAELFTIPDKLYLTYGKGVGLMGSFFVFFTVVPASYVLMLAVLLKLLFGWSILTGLIIGSIFSICYIYFGGLGSVVKTDIIQFILMYIGFAVIIPFAGFKYGGFSFLKSNLPPLHLTWHGGNSLQYIIVWFFIAMWTLIDPGFHQRCYAAKSGTTARRGILISIFFWFIFDAMTTFTGLYSRAIIPGIDPMMSYPLLGDLILPPFIKGLFFVGILSTIMSTVDSLSFLSAVTIGRDFMWRILGGDESKVNLYTKFGLILSGIISIAIAFLIPSVVKIWYTIGTIFIPGLIFPLVSSYFPPLKINSKFILATGISGWLTSFLWILIGQINKVNYSPQYPMNIEPMYPGLIIALIVYLTGYIFQKFEKRGVKLPLNFPS
ncbi:MAG: sodium:solute symporter [Fidelibacterota bacterium]